MICTTYVLMYDNKYLKFGSYSSATLTDDPLKASTYSRKKDVISRQKKRMWLNGMEQSTFPVIKELVFHLVDVRNIT